MNFPGRAVLLLPLALLVSPAGAAPAVIAPVVAQPAAAEAPAPAAPSAVSSSIVITLGATGDFDRKTVNYGCEGDVDHLAVDYINAAPNYLALLPLDGSTLLFNTVLAIAVLRVCGVPLSLFHLVAVTLAAGLGLHYALFFERPVADAGEARRTLHATLVCVAAAVLVFGLLATSAVPVLRAIGATVALGVTFHFILSTQMAMRRNRDVG